MATYATYRHVELDKIGQGKKRVLKPPGGGSSISFLDDNTTPSTSSGQSSPQESTPSSSPGETHGKTSPIPENESTVSTPPSELKNGTHNVEKGNSPLLKENIPPVLSEKEFESKLNISLNGCKKNKEIDSIPEIQSPSNSDVKNDIKPKSLNGVNGLNLIGTNERENNSNLVNGNSLFEKIDSSYLNKKIGSPLAQNGSKSHTPTLSPTHSILVATPSMKPNQDTQERVIGHDNGCLTPQPSQQTRKIKDHMRSSIIMSDEDYTPTRSSRFNATVNDTPSENLPSAGARQRVPPGGYSTKLW